MINFTLWNGKKIVINTYPRTHFQPISGSGHWHRDKLAMQMDGLAASGLPQRMDDKMVLILKTCLKQSDENVGQQSSPFWKPGTWDLTDGWWICSKDVKMRQRKEPKQEFWVFWSFLNQDTKDILCKLRMKRGRQFICKYIYSSQVSVTDPFHP
jgi:hypothetical protein